MPKNLNDILKGVKKSTTNKLTTGDNPGVDYADKMKDTRYFLDQHSVEKHEDRVGNGDEVYKASNVKKAAMQRHGHEPKPKDIRVYDKTNQIRNEEVEELEEAKKTHVIIGNAGRGRQNMWPSSDSPKLYSASEASKIVSKANDRGLSSGMNIFYHAKHIDDAHEYVSPDQPAWHGLQRLKLKNSMKEEVEKLEEANLMHIKVGEKVRLTNPKASPKHTVDKIKGDKVHITKDSGEKVVMPLDRIKRVKAQAMKLREDKDNREYDYEGEMAVTKLKTIVRAAEHLIKMMKPNTNLPEWVQAKIIKAEDYITTAHDYLMSEMNEETELSEAKCNMSEAGTMCEVHGKKACPSEDDESAENKEPKYTGKKDKEGKTVLITDKKQIQEKLTKKTPVGKIIKDVQKSDDPRFEGDSQEKRKERALAIWYKLHPEKSNKVEEGFLDQRSKKSTASEEARKKMSSELTKKKEKIFDSDLRKQEIVFSHKLKNGKGKIKEQSAPADTSITFPATNSREGLKV